MADIATAFVHVVPSAQGIQGSLTEAFGGEADNAGKSIGSSLASKIKSVIVAAGIGKAITDTIRSAVQAGGELEQSIGGIETLFGPKGAKSIYEYSSMTGKCIADIKDEYKSMMEGQELALSNASQAWKTTGLSANEYMQNISGFAAALNTALGGDTVASAKAADQAMRDMADNSNKMGTSMADIQHAYQGFAKQNYTMLDNLKLGYGGTKTEMERLLADAQKISGVKYDISNLADVYEAIHVIQGEIGITGTTAKEAEKTLQGSANAMKAAWTDLLGNIATGGNIESSVQNLLHSVRTFLGNLIPMIGNVLKNGFKVLSSLLVNDGMEMMKSLGSGFTNGIPTMLAEVLPAILQFSEGLKNSLPEFINIGLNMILGLAQGLVSSIPMLIAYVPDIISNLISAFVNGIQAMAGTGTQIVNTLVNGLVSGLPGLISTAFSLITEFANGVLSSLPSILEAGASIALNLLAGIVSHLPDIISSAATSIAQFCATIAAHLPEILQKGIEIIGQLVEGLIQAIPDILAAIPQIINSMVDAFMNFDWIGLGKDIIDGIANGIKSAAGALADAAMDAAKGAFDAATSFFQTGSPSRLMEEKIGYAIPEGAAIGVNKKASVFSEAMTGLGKEAYGSLESELSEIAEISNPGISGIYATSIVNGVYEPRKIYNPAEDFAHAIGNASEDQNVTVNVTLQGDAEKLFKVIDQHNTRRTRATNYNTLAFRG